MNLSAQQEKALDIFVKIVGNGHCTFVIRGFAGTGKTSILKEMAESYTLAVLTPTGKAARRANEVSGVKAQTLHSFLYIPIEKEWGEVAFEPKLGEDYKDSLDLVDAIVVDEASMLSADLWRDVKRTAEDFGLPLILLGDGYQLPPVEKIQNGPTFSAMSDEFIAQNATYNVDFTEVFRQAQESPILRVATAIRAGDDIPSLLATTFPILSLEEVYAKGASFAQGEDGMVICHRNITRHDLNNKIRAKAGFYGRMPVPGEKLMVTKNNPKLGLVNGEIITMTDKSIPLTKMPVSVKDSKANEMQGVDYFSNSFFNGFSDTLAVMSAEGVRGELKINEWCVQKEARKVMTRSQKEPLPYLYANYGYAGTAHKAQGSQYDSVVMVLEPTINLYQRDGRRWTYTTLTRAIQDFSYTVIP